MRFSNNAALAMTLSAAASTVALDPPYMLCAGQQLQREAPASVAPASPTPHILESVGTPVECSINKPATPANLDGRTDEVRRLQPLLILHPTPDVRRMQLTDTRSNATVHQSLLTAAAASSGPIRQVGRIP